MTETNSKRRRDTLPRAVDVLEGCADRAELAYTVAELSDTYVLLGEPRRARHAAQLASGIAGELSLEPLSARLELGRRPIESASFSPQADSACTDSSQLSAAERRVVMFAVAGRTNREIAAELYITVSTVEQHLTRVYRKWQVKGRGDLALHLGANAGSGGSQFTVRGVA
ncbi:DNA-binding CsgD family transcriptional regulator [Rhodococcus sp. 27YEA15]